jgi:acyl dehydratase
VGSSYLHRRDGEAGDGHDGCGSDRDDPDGDDDVATDDPPDAWPGGAPRIGDRASRSRLVTPEDIERFTAISGDRNPIHYDDEVAAATVLGGIVVQGGVITAILNAVVAEDLPGPGTVFLGTEWAFRAPVRPGDRITGSVEVLEVRDDKPITRLATTVTRDDGTISVDGTATCYTLPIPRWTAV